MMTHRVPLALIYENETPSSAKAHQIESMIRRKSSEPFHASDLAPSFKSVLY